MQQASAGCGAIAATLFFSKKNVITGWPLMVQRRPALTGMAGLLPGQVGWRIAKILFKSVGKV